MPLTLAESVTVICFLAILTLEIVEGSCNSNASLSNQTTLRLSKKSHGKGVALRCTVGPPRGRTCIDYSTWFEKEGDENSTLRNDPSTRKYFSLGYENETCTLRLSIYSITTKLAGVYVCKSRCNLNRHCILENKTVLYGESEHARACMMVGTGDNVSVICPGTEPNVRVTWWKVDENKFLCNGTLWLKNVTESDEGVYKCLAVRNELHHAMSTLELLVRTAESVTKSDKFDEVVQLDIREGQTVRLNCSLSRANNSITWKIENERINVSLLYPISEKTDLHYQLQNATRLDNGLYKCTSHMQNLTIVYKVNVRNRNKGTTNIWWGMVTIAPVVLLSLVIYLWYRWKGCCQRKRKTRSANNGISRSGSPILSESTFDNGNIFETPIQKNEPVFDSIRSVTTSGMQDQQHSLGREGRHFHVEAIDQIKDIDDRLAKVEEHVSYAKHST